MKNKILIFGYGSLINNKSLKKTLPKAEIIDTGILRGYKRVFGTKSTNRLTKNNRSISVLNIEKNPKYYLNGVIIEINENDQKDLGERESAYERKELKVITDKNQELNALVFIDNSGITLPYLKDEPIQKNYLNVCLKGAKSHGEKFHKEFLETTFIYNKNLTN